MRNLFKITMVGLLGLFMVVGLQAQDTKPRLSPAKEASGKIGKAMVTINYSSPGVKGRTIWGELVPFDKIWRAGANEATTISTTKDLILDGEKLSAGTYSIFIIPRENGPATVIFNKVAKQSGTNNYDESEDALRLEVSPQENSMTERLEYIVNSKSIEMAWEKWKLSIDAKSK